jgi:hypothetical protein
LINALIAGFTRCTGIRSRLALSSDTGLSSITEEPVIAIRIIDTFRLPGAVVIVKVGRAVAVVIQDVVAWIG